MSLVAEQNYKKIIKVLEQQLINNPENHSILNEIGLCYTQLGDFAKAEEKFKIATCLKSNDIETIQYYSYVLFKLGKFANAVNILETALNITPENVVLNHQLSFIYSQIKDFKKSLFYINNAIICSQKHLGEIDLNLLSHKAYILEYFDKNKAIDIHLAIINRLEDNADSYDRLANLVISNFKFSKPFIRLNNNLFDYQKATLLLRKGDIDTAIDLYKQIIKKDKYCYPAYLGISQGLYEKRFSIREINSFDCPHRIEQFVKNYNQLNSIEKNIINASIKPFENFVDRLIKYNSLFTIVPIDIKITDLPENAYLQNKNYIKTMPFDTLRGIGGTNAFVGIERLRDLLWNIPPNIKFTPASAAHEFAHQVWCILDKDIIDEITLFYDVSLTKNDFISNYSTQNAQEYFAEYYAYYVRAFSSGEELDLNDPMLKLIDSLRNK